MKGEQLEIYAWTPITTKSTILRFKRLIEFSSYNFSIIYFHIWRISLAEKTNITDCK